MKNAPLYLIFALITIPHVYSCSVAADDSIWLARSCAGETGWKGHETGECAAILHVYRKRAESAGVSTVEMARQYSAAIKRYKGRPNRWVLFLDGSDEPKFWPLCAKWKYAVMDWLQTRFIVALFTQGRLKDPLPDAWHYGSVDDPQPSNTELIKTDFGNRFYKIKHRRKTP